MPSYIFLPLFFFTDMGGGELIENMSACFKSRFLIQFLTCKSLPNIVHKLQLFTSSLWWSGRGGWDGGTTVSSMCHTSWQTLAGGQLLN